MFMPDVDPVDIEIMTAAPTVHVPDKSSSAILGWLLLIAVLGLVYLVQPQFVCACALGVVYLKVSYLIEACVLARALIGLWRRHTSQVWALYLLLVISLPWLVPLVIEYHAHR